MNLQDLRYFQRLVQERSFTKVAEFYHVSQPTITLSLKRMEKEFQTRLVERNHNHNELQITESGRQLYHHVEPMLNEWRLAHQEIYALNRQIIRFGMSPTISARFFPGMTNQLLKSGLLNHLYTYEAGSRELLHAVLEGKIDIGLIGSVTPPVDEQLIEESLKVVPFKIVAGPGSPLAACRSVSFREVGDFPFVVLDNHYANPVAFTRISRQAGVSPKIIYRTSNIDTLKRIVSGGMAISYIADLSILPGDPIVSIPLTDQDQPVLTVMMVYRKTLELTERVNKFMDIVRKYE
jgi:DNA-binding transcriptional LysR family regulator